ncbi:hypothetical protein E2C06_01315 [Dankookia rubra]|uniref:Uncharacterized protein n=1 Tax=Dankookia rubra TaxID=1442381 RepID=A0A4R5QPQ9_9PROT|nr:hypothetical protein [Dankookia rubra]TDH64611.1 hypothetical protein E2C06_01315 [Dankookia rubra]
MVDAVDPALGEALPATPVEAAGPPGVLEGHILTLREALATATAATAEARRLAEQRGETLEAQALAHEAALAERDSMLAAGATALRDSRAALLALANRRSWEIVAHAAQLSEATRVTQAARAELAAASLRFQTASQAIVAATEAEAAALRQQVAAAERDRDAARQALAHWRRGGRLARMLRAFIG